MQAIASFKRWLFRLYGPEPAPIALTQRRVYVLPSRAGLAYAASLGLMLLGAINYNLSLGYALVFLLTGLGLVTLLHTFRNLVQLEISPGRAEPVFMGETALFGLLLHNPRGQDRYAIRLQLEGGRMVSTDMMAAATVTLRLPVATKKRGWFRPGRVTLETHYPLCLVRAWSYVEPDMRCLVYPRPEVDAPPLPYAAAGDTSGNRAGKGTEDFFGLRPHSPSDSPRHIAWKAVAREQPLLIKQFAGANSAQIWLDWAELPTDLDVEARLSRLTRWLLDAHATGLAFGLRLGAVEFPLGLGDRHFRDCLEALALYGEARS